MSLLSSSGVNSVPSELQVTGPSDLAKPYAEDILAKGSALLKNPAPAYTGQLTAGTSPLQAGAWTGLANLTLPESMTTATNNLNTIQNKAQNTNFDPNSIQQYMNPYLQGALEPQLAEARRQAAITQMNNQAQLTKQGAYGGGRSAVVQAEGQRNLATNLANITGQGYNTAYDNAMKAAQYGSTLGLEGLKAATSANQASGNIGGQQAQYGLQNIQALATAGNTQQAQNQAALNALYNQYLDQRNYPATLLTNQANLVKGLGGQNVAKYSAAQSGLQKAVGATAGVTSLIQNLKAAGKDVPYINNVLKSIGINPDTLKNTTPVTSTSPLPPGMVYDNSTGLFKDPTTGALYGLDGNGEVVPYGDYNDLPPAEVVDNTQENVFDPNADLQPATDDGTDFGTP